MLNIQNQFLVASRVLRIIRLLRTFAFTKVIVETFRNCFQNFINIRT